jgi:hypothetical protein
MLNQNNSCIKRMMEDESMKINRKLLPGIDFKKEYELIKHGKSKLSRMKRDAIRHIVEVEDKK